MHELSLAMALVEQVQRLCEAEQAPAVASIRLRIGVLAGVDREAFAFVFPLAAEGTCAEGAQLVFEQEAAEIVCEACGQKSAPARFFPRCNACGSHRVRIVAGRDFRIVSVEVREDGAAPAKPAPG